MLTPAAINIQSFFYPIGNTPAISLSQSLPPGDPADILLLGCGDVRNILFTIHNDSKLLSMKTGRDFDITCCDNQKAVIARNILLLSLIIDDEDGKNADLSWNIYYHMYLDKPSLDLLRSHSQMLCRLSSTMDTWQKSKYGRYLRFTDYGTLSDVRKMFEFFSIEMKKVDVTRFKSIIDNAKARQRDRISPGNEAGINMTGLRSAAPAHIGCLPDLDTLVKDFWKHGTTHVREDIRSASKHPNPAFMTVGDGAILHYGADPLLGFHLAAVDAPLDSNNGTINRPPDSNNGNINRPPDSNNGTINRLPRLERYGAIARAEFREWMASFRKQITENRVKLRFFTGDAVSFAYTLQHTRATSELKANWYRDRHGVSPLVLDGADYASGGNAPVDFDVIDTSNLCDHLGALTLLTATSPLLRDHASAVLYTEILANNHKSAREALNHMLCGDPPTLSTLLGLMPMEYWTNTSPTPIGEELLAETFLMEGLAQYGTVEQTLRQLFLRTSWKRVHSTSSVIAPSTQSIPLHIDPKQLARTVYNVYVHMFLDEDMAYQMSNITLERLQKSSLVWYQRPSFAAFLKMVKTRVTCNWNQMMEHTMELIENRQNAPMGMNYYQELNVWFHLLGVHTTDAMKEEWRHYEGSSLLTPLLSPVNSLHGKWGCMRDWKSIPPIVCINLKVPRKELRVFTSMELRDLGTPVVNCKLQGAEKLGMARWQNLLPACQLSFGDITKRVENDISVREDDAGWRGTSPLIVSFFAPTFLLFQQPEDIAVAFGIHSSPATVHTFMSRLGMNMDVYETTLDNSDAIFITRFAPNQTGFPIATGFTQTTPAKDVDVKVKCSLIAVTDLETGNMMTVTGRLDIISSDLKKALANGCEVSKSTISPYEVAISLGQNVPLGICFPVFVKEASHLRIARKSSYIEVVTQAAGCSDWMTFPQSMFLMHPESRKPICNNIPYINLQKCPVIQVTQHKKLDWLVPHVSLIMSTRERALRDNEALPRSASEKVRLDFKESLFTMFVQFVGLQGEKSNLICLHHPTKGGVHIIIMMSSLRLNLQNRSVILDCAVLPLTDAMMPNISHALAEMTQKRVTKTKVDDAELLLWRHALPTYVERCRDWDHRDNCEYVVSGSIPLNTSNGQPVLCTCGSGKFPPNFIKNVPGWNMFSKYAVRAAISPTFWAPFADELYIPDVSGGGNRPDSSRCVPCGKPRQADGSELMSCARCKKVKYCSRACQRVDWGTHKPSCQ